MFFATKLYRPPLPAGTINRERLYAALDQGWADQARLLLVSAPPGYGKTTLFSGWVQARELPCAWVALDEQDNDPARFFLLILRALRPYLPGLASMEAVLNTPQALPIDELVVEVVNQALRSDRAVLLALDDYHVITAQPVHALLQWLLAHLPPQLRLAVLTREDPPLPLAQLRVRRQMVEVRARQLNFSMEESAALLVDSEHLPLDPAQVAALQERTEGWAAGLQLAALTLRDHPQPAQLIDSFSGSHRYVLDYLAGEVLERTPADLRAFLCRSAVLGRFNAGLCDAALQTTSSRELIARAAAANLFLVPLDEERIWYRYHHLMGDILKAEVPLEERAALARRAAAWLHEHGQPLDAVQLALEARDYPLAAELMHAALIPAAESGLLVTALNWLAALPEDVLFAHPELCVLRAWFLLFNGQFPEAVAWMRQVSARLTNLSPALAGLLTGMQSWMLTASGQRPNLEILQAAFQAAREQYPYFSPLMLLAIGQAQRAGGQLQAAIASYEEGLRAAEAAASPVSTLILGNNLAFSLDAAGQRETAQRQLAASVERYQPGPLSGIPQLALGCLLAESGRLAEAEAALTQSLHRVRRLGLYHVLSAPATYSLQQVLSDQGRLAEALEINADTRRKALQAGISVVVESSDQMAAWFCLLNGDPAPAERYAAAHPLPEGSTGEYDAFKLTLFSRLMVQQGQPARAIELVKPALETAQAAGLRINSVRLALELAIAQLAAGQKEAALKVLAPAIDSAAEMDLLQPVRRAAPALAPLLESLRSQHPAFIAAALGPVSAPIPAPGRKPAPAMIDPPGERELEILRLVAAGLSNAEIADRLYITTGTVKWHLNHLFARLGASRRTEAVVMARELGLL